MRSFRKESLRPLQVAHRVSDPNALGLREETASIFREKTALAHRMEAVSVVLLQDDYFIGRTIDARGKLPVCDNARLVLIACRDQIFQRE